MKAAYFTVGCKLNQYDTEAIAGSLQRLGFDRVDWSEKADLYIINSCNVTIKAAADSRRKIYSARRNSPHAKIVITGCYAQIQADRIGEIEEVDLIVGNDRKESLITEIAGLYPEIADQIKADMPEIVDSFEGHTRGMVKIQDGCNQNCSYCVVPQGRGSERSRKIELIINEALALYQNDYREIILTGVHIGRFRQNGISLSGLVKLVLDRTPVERIRLSSLEVNEIDDILIQLTAANSRVCPHFHVPLQSGSDEILKLMKRPYKSEKYLERIKALKHSIPNVMIGVDVIVGFPGESDDHFRQTMDFVRNSPIDYLHVFSYSDHPQARSYNYEGKIDPFQIKARNRELTELGDAKWLAFLETQMDRDLPVLFERRRTKKGGFLTGLSDNYIRVKCVGPDDYFNTIAPVRPTRIEGLQIVGQLSSSG